MRDGQESGAWNGPNATPGYPQDHHLANDTSNRQNALAHGCHRESKGTARAPLLLLGSEKLWWFRALSRRCLDALTGFSCYLHLIKPPAQSTITLVSILNARCDTAWWPFLLYWFVNIYICLLWFFFFFWFMLEALLGLHVTTTAKLCKHHCFFTSPCGEKLYYQHCWCQNKTVLTVGAWEHPYSEDIWEFTELGSKYHHCQKPPP